MTVIVQWNGTFTKWKPGWIIASELADLHLFSELLVTERNRS